MKRKERKKAKHIYNTKLLTFNIKVSDFVAEQTETDKFKDNRTLGIIVSNVLSCVKKQSKLVYSRNTSVKKKQKKQNTTTYRVIKAVDFLTEEGYITNHIGKASKSADYREISYIEPTAKFVEKFVTEQEVVEAMIAYMEAYKVIELRDDEKQSIDFRWTEERKKQAELIRKLNILNESATVTTGDGELLTNIYCRIFNGDFKHGGRFYRSDIVRMKNKEQQRLDVKIDGEDVVEIDYSNHHFRITSVLYDFDQEYLGNDVYSNVLDDEDNAIDRWIVKRAVNIMFNAESEESARKAIAKEIETLTPEERATATLLNAKAVMMLIFDEYDQFSIVLCRNASFGKELQFHDSEIASIVLQKMIDKNIVCLPIHDSFVVQAKHRQALTDAMADAFREYLNYTGVVYLKVCERLNDGSVSEEAQIW